MDILLDNKNKMWSRADSMPELKNLMRQERQSTSLLNYNKIVIIIRQIITIGDVTRE